MRNVIILILMIAAAAMGWFVGARYGFQSHFTAKQVNVATNAVVAEVKPVLIRAQGKIQPADGLINIVAAPGDRIDSMTDKSIGDQVSKDEILVTLSSRSLREKDLELAKARRTDAITNFEYQKNQGSLKLKTAHLAVEEAMASDDQIAQQVETIGLLKDQQGVAEKMLQRLQRLRSNDSTRSLVNLSDIEKQQLVVEQLSLQIKQAESTVKLATESADRNQESANNNLKSAQYGFDNAVDATPMKSLNAAVALAQKAYDLTQLRAPRNATIIDIILHTGDSVTNRPILLLADVSHMNCEVEVVDSYLKQIDIVKHQNLRARISGVALPQPLFGTVVAKGRMVGPISLQSPNPFEKVDQHTGVVTVRLDDPAVAANFINLQIDVEIETSPGTLEPAEKNIK